MPEPSAPPPAPSPDRQALDRLVDALVADVLAASDADVLAEFRETDGDPEQYAAQMRATFERMIQQEAPAPDLAAIEARAAAATPPPWELYYWRRGKTGRLRTMIRSTSAGAHANPLGEFVGFSVANQTLLLQAASDVPALVAYARALAAENAGLRAGLAPLAALLTAIPDEWPDNRPIYIRNDAPLTVGDIRAAHALLIAP